MTIIQVPPCPIIYVRGYAMTDREIESTTADPFCGFNLGSTVHRAVVDKRQRPRKFIFESPIVRLMSDFGYVDVFKDGHDILENEEMDGAGAFAYPMLARSIIIYRYYDAASRMFGSGETPEIEEFAKGLGALILRARDRICANTANGVAPKDFRCHLVAHSMGGLVCRAFLQNPNCDPDGAARYVDKLFTYATPHNGIDILGINVPGWLKTLDIDNFDRDRRMPKYLDLERAAKQHKRVDLIPEERFPSRKVFCMVATNRMDYETLGGLSRAFVGNGSDGLVRIENATLHGLNADGSIGTPCAKAFAYRAHSGDYGIVNSEEAYQNLTRFLFGDVRVDIWLDVGRVRLPADIRDRKKVNALYAIELQAAPRGKLWSLTRRKMEENSVACFTHEEWVEQGDQVLSKDLSTVLLAKYARVDSTSDTLSYFMNLGIRVPDYEVSGALWLKQHFEGRYLFQNEIVVSVSPPRDGDTHWRVQWAWQDGSPPSPEIRVDPEEFRDGAARIEIPVVGEYRTPGKTADESPGIEATLRLMVSQWH